MKPPGAGYRWVILLLLGASNACNIGVFFLTPPLASFFQSDWGITRVEVGLLMSALLVGAAITSIPGGLLANRSIRWTMISCQGLTTISLVFFSRTDNLEQAMLGTFGMGLGAGATFTAMTKAAATWFQTRERATALGLLFAGGSIGASSGAVLLPALALAIGWRQAVLIVAVVLMGAGIAGFAFYRDSQVPAESGPAPSEETLSARGDSPYSNILILGIMSVLLGAPQYALATYIVLYLKENLHMSVVAAGIFLSVVQGSSLFGRIGWGIVSDRLLHGNRKAVLLISAVLYTICLAIIATGFSAPGGLLALMFVSGISGFSWYGIWMTLVAESSRMATGITIGLGQTFSYIGVIVGPPIFGYVVDTARSYTPAWIGSAIAVGLSAILVLLVKESRSPLTSGARGTTRAGGSP